MFKNMQSIIIFDTFPQHRAEPFSISTHAMDVVEISMVC